MLKSDSEMFYNLNNEAEKDNKKDTFVDAFEEDKELLEVKISASAHNRILELEKENNQLKLEIADLYKSRGEYEKTKSIMTNELRDYIPKSLIKEKIEELNTMIIETHRGNLQRYTVSEILSFIRFYEELLGEEK